MQCWFFLAWNLQDANRSFGKFEAMLEAVSNSAWLEDRRSKCPMASSHKWSMWLRSGNCGGHLRKVLSFMFLKPILYSTTIMAELLTAAIAIGKRHDIAGCTWSSIMFRYILFMNTKDPKYAKKTCPKPPHYLHQIESL